MLNRVLFLVVFIKQEVIRLLLIQMDSFQFTLLFQTLHKAPEHSILKFLRYIYLFKAKRQKEREIFHPLTQSPNGRNGQCYTMPKTGAQSFFQFSHTRAGVQAPELSSATFPGLLTGTASKAENLNGAHIRCQHHRVQLNHLQRRPALDILKCIPVFPCP